MRIVAAVILVIAPCLPFDAHARQEAAPPEPAAAPQTAEGIVAVPAPLVRLSGHVLMKDGVTPVEGAELRLTSLWDGETALARSDDKGRYEVDLVIGRYKLQIENRMAVYDSPSRYAVPRGDPLTMDFLLLPDFEKEGAPAPAGSRRLPDPRRESERVVGSIVDMVPAPEGKRGWRWAETLAFVGSFLAIAVVAN
jgi:hypothetical protein